MEYGDESGLVGKPLATAFEGIFFQNFVSRGWKDMGVKANLAGHVTFLILGTIWFLLNSRGSSWSTGTNRGLLEGSRQGVSKAYFFRIL